MSALRRVGRAWRALEPDQRLAGIAALLLLASMLLPWYEVTTSFSDSGRPRITSVSHSAFGVYSFVEAAIFLVCVAVFVLLFARGERRAFHLPGGDGTVLMAAGLWVMILIFYRQLDKPKIQQSGGVGTVGVQWGIFIAFLLGALLAYAGFRIRAARIAEPPADDVAAPSPREGRSFEDAPTTKAPREDGAVSVSWEDAPTRRAGGRGPTRDVFERPADPEDPTEFEPPRRPR